MRVFVTGATGFVGSAVVQELLKNGHQVLGLVRSEASAKALVDAGGEALRGTIEDLDALKKGAAETDGVLHLAFGHDFSKYMESCAIDRKAIETIGGVLEGTGRPFVITSGTLVITNDKILDEQTGPGPTPTPRALSETVTLELASKGVRAMVLRLSPSVHGDGDKGFISMVIDKARERGVAGYVNDGHARWPAVHRLDAAVLYRLALEKGVAGARYHAVADEAVATKDIAEAIGKKLNLPVEGVPTEKAAESFGFIWLPLSMDNPSSSKWTQEQLGWSPSQVGLIEDIEKGTYFN